MLSDFGLQLKGYTSHGYLGRLMKRPLNASLGHAHRGMDFKAMR